MLQNFALSITHEIASLSCRRPHTLTAAFKSPAPNEHLQKGDGKQHTRKTAFRPPPDEDDFGEFSGADVEEAANPQTRFPSAVSKPPPPPPPFPSPFPLSPFLITISALTAPRSWTIVAKESCHLHSDQCYLWRRHISCSMVRQWGMPTQ